MVGTTRRQFFGIVLGAAAVKGLADAGELYERFFGSYLLPNESPAAQAADVAAYLLGNQVPAAQAADVAPYRPQIVVPDLTKEYVPKDAFSWDDAVEMGNIDPGVYPPSKVYKGDKGWDENKVDPNLKLEGVARFKKDCTNSKLLVQAELFRSVEYIRQLGCDCFDFNISVDQFLTKKKDPDEKYWSIAYSQDFEPCLAYAHDGMFPKEHPYKNVKAEYQLWVGKSPDSDIDHHILQAVFDLTDQEVELPLADKTVLPPLSFNSNHPVIGIEIRAGFYKKDLWQPLLDELPIKRLYWPIRSDATNWADLSLVNPNIVCKTSTTAITTEEKTSSTASTSAQLKTSAQTVCPLPTPATTSAQLSTSTQTACPILTAEPLYTVPKSTVDIATAAIVGGVAVGVTCVGVHKLRNKQKPQQTPTA
jgi:hypothetical protein